MIVASVRGDCPVDAKPEALAYLEQARDFYTAAVSASVTAARPLLLYYCFMNLAKAFVIHRGAASTLVRAHHGLSDQSRTRSDAIGDAFLAAKRTTEKRPMVFDAFLLALRGNGLSEDHEYDLSRLVPQILSGHRLWADAVEQRERFIAIHEIQAIEDKQRKRMWLRLFFFDDDLTRLDVLYGQLLRESRLGDSFRQVRTNTREGKRRLVCFEQLMPVPFKQRPSDEAEKLVATVRSYLWTTVASVPPYRRYYAYLSPLSEHDMLLPQLASIYAVMFYLGSITRYRPHHFDSLIESALGPRIEEFIAGQPLQFIYLMASEFARQEVTRPSIV
jgi:hypothetical protein